MTMQGVTRLMLAGLVALLAACGDGDSDSGDDGDAEPRAEGISISMTEFAFDPEVVEIDADTAVTITVVNDGVVEHDWTIDELDVMLYADTGESTTGTVTAAAGTYEVYCTIPGHRESGMVGELIAS